MNMNLYGHDEQWVMVDCGVTFRDADGSKASGYEIQMADPAFIEQYREQLKVMILTHAHEDHIGAVAHLWRRLRCPVMTTRFTAELLQAKLAEHGLTGKVPITIVEPGERKQIDAFDIEWVAHTHSVPNPCGVVLRTAAGSAFHTADWKLDPNPLIGHGYSEAHYRKIGKSGIDALICDSTGASQPGHSLSEKMLRSGLLQHISQAEGRVIVACFGSNIARLHTLGRIADDTGRHLGLLGRSLINTATAARRVGLWRASSELVRSDHLAYLPRHTLLLVATGSQGEKRTALHRLSLDSFKDLSLDAGDTVIFSARMIPGNELAVQSMITRLENRGIHVITPETSALPIHASGHPNQDELAKLYGWINPRLLVPVHGEDSHMAAQLQLARQSGIKHQLLGRNGDLFMLAPAPGVRRQAATTGRLGVGRQSLEKVA